MKWHFSEDRAIYSQIVEQIKRFIVSGELKAGERLNSVRELAAEAGVNPNTMQRALSELERMGLLCSQRTAGRFVTEDEDLIEIVKTETAFEKVKTFVEEMKGLGYSKSDIEGFLKNHKEDKGDE